MSQALMDYVTARHASIVAVLGMLKAEHALSDDLSSVIDVTDAEREVDGAARKLAEATGELPRDRRPVGWHEPPPGDGVLREARVRFVRAALRCLSAEYAAESADAASESEYADEQLAIAARDLAAGADAHRAAKRVAS